VLNVDILHIPLLLCSILHVSEVCHVLSFHQATLSLKEQSPHLHHREHNCSGRLLPSWNQSAI